MPGASPLTWARCARALLRGGSPGLPLYTLPNSRLRGCLRKGQRRSGRGEGARSQVCSGWVFLPPGLELRNPPAPGAKAAGAGWGLCMCVCTHVCAQPRRAEGGRGDRPGAAVGSHSTRVTSSGTRCWPGTAQGCLCSGGPDPGGLLAAPRLRPQPRAPRGAEAGSSAGPWPWLSGPEHRRCPAAPCPCHPCAAPQHRTSPSASTPACCPLSPSLPVLSPGSPCCPQPLAGFARTPWQRWPLAPNQRAGRAAGAISTRQALPRRNLAKVQARGPWRRPAWKRRGCSGSINSRRHCPARQVLQEAAAQGSLSCTAQDVSEGGRPLLGAPRHRG